MKIKALLVGGPMYEALYERLSEFEDREGVEVERVVSRDHPDLNARIVDEFGGGTADYDVISTHTKYAPSQRRWLAPLDEEFGDEGLMNFSGRALDLARVDGSLYSVPRNMDVKLLHYRTDLIREPPSTWEELLETAKEQSSGEMHGFAFPGKESGLFGHFFELHAMHGGAMFESDGPPAPRLNDEAGFAALSLLKELYEKTAPPQTPDWHYDEVAACFRAGRAAMSTDWPGGLHTYESEGSVIKGKYDLALYPEGPSGRFVYGGCHSFAVSRAAQDHEAAVALLRFLTSRESQLSEARLGTLPARTDALEAAHSEAREGSFTENRWGLLAETQKAAIIPPKHENYPAVEDAVWKGIRAALIGEKTIERALEDAQRDAGAVATRAMQKEA